MTNLQNKVPVSTEFIRRVVVRALKELGCEGEVEVSVALVDDAYIQELNREYRGVHQPTDVLGFPLEEEVDTPIRMLGDIVISVERAREQARQYNHSLRRELALLAIHGLLHLLGYEDETDEGAAVMWRRQRALLEILEREGILERTSPPRRAAR
ncbi:MAG: rRNA maturation RNase YbeY [Armatimonadota bacterium]|nr:rRNA maturation RNase YbeY [Armatimonadota bacterium]MDR5702987.1 rRNA maturation RNase YbeY [Armatimonadota bacterium]MDR7433715.1 rRNA maturation RNase YbeY [Armatimonadota bacterium]